MDQDAPYILPSTETEAQRLEAQGVLYGGTDFLREFLQPRPARVLEVGCGGGFMCRHVAHALPDSAVVGIDIDASRVAWARRQHHGANCSFTRGDVRALPLEPNSFDLVFTRMCLLHQPDLSQALREMTRVVVPGGRIVAYEMVHDGVWFSPPKPAFEAVLARILGWMKAHDIEPSQGLHVPGAMKRAGLVDVTATVVPHSVMGDEPQFDAYRRNWIETLRQLDPVLVASREPGAEETDATAADASLWTAALGELQDLREDQLLVEITVLAAATRP